MRAAVLADFFNEIGRKADLSTVAPAESEYRSWTIDGRRWKNYRPRADDIVIATYPKCGTTWMQRIVSLLVFQTTEPKPIMEISAWLDRRFGEPIEVVLAGIEAQQHRRFLKAHLPQDGLPFYDEIKYIHVARDGRDACMSFHNHQTNFAPQVLERLNKIGMEDEAIGVPFPALPTDPAEFFHQWIVRDGFPTMSFFHFERTWWDAREYPNVLLVHYNDLKADIAGEMRRISDFLSLSVPSILWPELVAAAGFEAMQRDGERLMGKVAKVFKGGSQRFFFKGMNERWRGVVSEQDLALYEARAEAAFTPECARWVSQGRLAAGDPRLM
jgi:aryl sulfotransferase